MRVSRKLLPVNGGTDEEDDGESGDEDGEEDGADVEIAGVEGEAVVASMVDMAWAVARCAAVCSTAE